MLEELSAPDGYLVAEDIKFTVQSDGRVVVDSTYVNVVTMKDEATLLDLKRWTPKLANAFPARSFRL